MKYKVYLDEEDIIKIIADRFNTLEKYVELQFKEINVGHGLDEHVEQVLKAEVTSDDTLV